MEIEFSTGLRPTLEEHGCNLRMHGAFVSEEDVVERHLNRGFGNADSFDQQDRLEETI